MSCQNDRHRLKILSLALVLLGWTISHLAAQDVAQRGIAQDTLDRIQRECLNAYPPDLLSALTGGSSIVSDEVNREPAKQIEFLRREIPREKGSFYPSMLDELIPIFERHVFSGTRFLDLGSGDGRVVFLASVLGADAYGIEYDKELIEVSLRAQRALEGVVNPRRVHFIQDDFFNRRWSGYDVIFYFNYTTSDERKLRAKLLAEMDPGARLIVAHDRKPIDGMVVQDHHDLVKVYVRADR